MAICVPPRARRHAGACAAVFVLCAAFAVQPAAATSTIIIEDPAGPIFPGDSFSFLVRIEGSVALAGYDVELEVTPLPGSTGTIMGNATLSNFYAGQNLLAQGGGGLHSTYSTITSLMPENPGLFIKAVDATFTAIAIPAPEQDVLAEVHFTASGDAFGEFQVALGDETLLAIDGTDQEDFPPAMITIRIPEPGYLGVLSGLALLLWGRQRKRV